MTYGHTHNGSILNDVVKVPLLKCKLGNITTSKNLNTKTLEGDFYFDSCLIKLIHVCLDITPDSTKKTGKCFVDFSIEHPLYCLSGYE